jgi:hypothetical protein
MLEKLKRGLKHAFAVTDPQSRITEEDIELLDRVAEVIVRRQMTLPAVVFLRSFAPMNYIGSQALQFLKPFLTLLFSEKEYTRFAEILEHRDAPELLSQRIEAILAQSRQAKEKV